MRTSACRCQRRGVDRRARLHGHRPARSGRAVSLAAFDDDRASRVLGHRGQPGGTKPREHLVRFERAGQHGGCYLAELELGQPSGVRDLGHQALGSDHARARSAHPHLAVPPCRVVDQILQRPRHRPVGDRLQLGQQLVRRPAGVERAVSGYEIGFKRAMGRLEAPDDLEEQIERHGFDVLSVTLRHATRAAELPGHHRDPFDRLLVAQADCEAATLVTVDRALAAYQVPILPAVR